MARFPPHGHNHNGPRNAYVKDGGKNMDERNNVQVEEAIEEIDALSQFFGTVSDVVARYTHCPLCGSYLHFSHVTDFAKNVTHETARCPECAIQVRKLMHKLQ
jgi:uncharacterized protein with PIN domain